MYVRQCFSSSSLAADADNTADSITDEHTAPTNTTVTDTTSASTSVPSVVAVVKIEPVDDNFPSETPGSSTTWVKIKDITLTVADKQLSTQGAKLSDKHINAAQRILKLMFPKINEL